MPVQSWFCGVPVQSCGARSCGVQACLRNGVMCMPARPMEPVLRIVRFQQKLHEPIALRLALEPSAHRPILRLQIEMVKKVRQHVRT